MKRGKLREEAIERGKEKLKDVEMDWWIELQRLVNFPRLDLSLAKDKNEKKKSDLVTFFRDRSFDSFDSRDLKKRTVRKKSKDVSTLNPITISVSTGCLAQPS